MSSVPENLPATPAPDFESFLPDDENGRLLRKMQAQGVDMNRVHQIEFFFEFPGETNAQAFQQGVIEPLVTEQCFPMESRWVVRVTKLLIPTHREINEIHDRLTHLASLHHGKPDGWGYAPN